jgi:hypothetical protein
MRQEKPLPDQQSGLDPMPIEHLVRAASDVALAAVAVIHVIDLSSTLSAKPLIGFGHFVLTAAQSTDDSDDSPDGEPAYFTC